MIASAPASYIVEPIKTKSRRKGVRAALDSKWVYLASAQDPEIGTAPDHTAKPTVKRSGTGRIIGATRKA